MVAEKAGVSLGTASLAMNNRTNVSPDTLARVHEAASAIGYRIKGIPSQPEGHTLSVIGMLTMHDVGTEPGPNIFYSHVQSGVEVECRRRNLCLMYSTVEVDHKKRPISWPVMIDNQRVDGLILIGTFIEDTIGRLHDQAVIPIALVDGYAPNLPFDTVLPDNIQGAFSAVEYLIKKGHSQIGMIGWNSQDDIFSIRERKEGYLRALQINGIEKAYIEESTLDTREAFCATQHLLERSPEVTAIFAANDEIAINAMNAAQELGRIVPDDLSVVGFDNIDLAGQIKPALTTVHVYKNWMGILGVRMLIDRASNPHQPKVTSIVATQLVIRESVKTMLGPSAQVGQ
jgi:LacI family transcriptional regulator